MIIYGAGMAGLLAGNMLRRWSPMLREAQPGLPDNHSALLRFRSDVVSAATGIPFRRVKVLKAVWRDGKLRSEATLRDNNEYAFKVAGDIIVRSVINLDPVERYIAPPGFISDMAESCMVTYDSPMTEPEECVSTIPMPKLMQIVGWADVPEFKYRPITTVNITIEHPKVDVYQTIYYPTERKPYYRASLTGNLLTIEYANVAPYVTDYTDVLEDFGLWSVDVMSEPKVSRQEYGKLLPIDDRLRKAFILAMTDQYRIYSLGRFGTWRQILMDDVVQDVRRIEGWLTERNQYGRHLHYSENAA